MSERIDDYKREEDQGKSLIDQEDCDVYELYGIDAITGTKEYHYIENTLLGKTLIGCHNGILSVRPLGHHGSARIYADVEGIEESGELTFFDKIVADAVYTLYDKNIKKFTLSDVVKIVNGGDVPSANLKSSVMSSIEKMRHIRISFDFASEMEERSNLKELLPEKQFYCSGYILPIKTTVGTTEKRKRIEFQVIAKPPLWEYAKCNGQIIAYDPGLLRVGEKNNNTDTLIIRYLILQRVLMAWNGKSSKYANQNGYAVITADELNDLLNLNSKDRQQKKRIVDTVQMIANAYYTDTELTYGYCEMDRSGAKNSLRKITIPVVPSCLKNNYIPETEELPKPQEASESKTENNDDIDVILYQTLRKSFGIVCNDLENLWRFHKKLRPASEIGLIEYTLKNLWSILKFDKKSEEELVALLEKQNRPDAVGKYMLYKMAFIKEESIKRLNAQERKCWKRS